MVTAHIGLPLVAGLTKWNLVESFTLVDQAKKKKLPRPLVFRMATLSQELLEATVTL